MRDFTFIDDIVESVYRIIKKPPIEIKNFDKSNPDSSKSWAPYRIFNIGNSNPTKLMDYIESIEKHTGKKAINSVNLITDKSNKQNLVKCHTLYLF